MSAPADTSTAAVEALAKKVRSIDPHDASLLTNARRTLRALAAERDAAQGKVAPLVAALYRALNYIENNESELGIKLNCGNDVRAAIDHAEAQP